MKNCTYLILLGLEKMEYYYYFIIEIINFFLLLLAFIKIINIRKILINFN